MSPVFKKKSDIPDDRDERSGMLGNYDILRDKNLRTLHGRKKLQYIFDYYKLPLVILCIVLYIIGYSIHGHFTHKEVTLYTAFINVSAGETLTQTLSTDFLKSQGLSTSKNEVCVYSGLYLTDDENNPNHEYTYASRMKLLASIDGKLLDVVLMDKEAFDAFSQNGYLCDLDKLLSQESPDLYETLKPYLVTNTHILKDNTMDLYFDESLTYEAETEEYPMGLNLSQSAFIRKAGFDGTVYLGIIANSPRAETAVSYLEYLYENVE